jgi:hypothetical protein
MINMYYKENTNLPELYFRKTAIAREVTLDSQDAVKFLSILFSKKILTTIVTRKKQRSHVYTLKHNKYVP